MQIFGYNYYTLYEAFNKIEEKETDKTKEVATQETEQKEK